METTPQRLNWLAEDAVRRETVSGGRISLQFAICREMFRNCRESDPITAKFSNDLKDLRRKTSRPRSREDFLVSQGRAAWNCEWWQGWRVLARAGQEG